MCICLCFFYAIIFFGCKSIFFFVVNTCKFIVKNDYNLSVSTYVEKEDTREKIDIDLEEYSKAWRELAAKRSEIDSLLSSTASEDELDLLRYQVGELEAARLTIEDDEIEERHAAAAHAEEIVELASSIADVLGGDNGVAERLISLQPKFNRLKKYFKESDDWANEAEDATIKIQELSRAIADAMTKIDADPAELEELDARLSIINRLKRKYLKNGENTVEALLAVLSAVHSRNSGIESSDRRCVRCCVNIGI